MKKNHPQKVKIMLEKTKSDDKDVGQGRYVGENWDPDYRRHEQASQLNINYKLKIINIYKYEQASQVDINYKS